MINIQLTLEQHRIELYGPTYTLITFWRFQCFEKTDKMQSLEIAKKNFKHYVMNPKTV